MHLKIVWFKFGTCTWSYALIICNPQIPPTPTPTLPRKSGYTWLVHYQNYSYILSTVFLTIYSKTCVKRTLSQRQKIGFQDQLSPNAGQKYCRMLQGGHSAILSNFIKLPFIIKIFVLSIFEWLFNTGFTVFSVDCNPNNLVLICKDLEFLRFGCKGTEQNKQTNKKEQFYRRAYFIGLCYI